MSAGRRSARRQAVFILYQQDLLGLTAQAALERAGEDKVASYARSLVLGVDKKREAIDRTLSEHVTGWTLERLGALERAVLRCAAYELSYTDDVPPAVAIDEAVGLAKRFCSTEAGALVNGVLGALAGGGAAVVPNGSQ